jgi:hypothetical protein
MTISLHLVFRFMLMREHQKQKEYTHKRAPRMHANEVKMSKKAMPQKIDNINKEIRREAQSIEGRYVKVNGGKVKKNRGQHCISVNP